MIFYFTSSATDLSEYQKTLLDWTEDMAETHTFHVSKSICLLSHYSFGETFERWLMFLQVGKQTRGKVDRDYGHLALLTWIVMNGEYARYEFLGISLET